MNRRTFLSSTAGGMLLMAGCSGESGSGDREVVPPTEPFTINDITYTVEGFTATSTFLGIRRYYADEGGLLINIDISQENTGDSTVVINTGGVVETPEGETYEPEGSLYGSEKILPGEEVFGSLLFAVPIEASEWDFIINNTAIPIPKTPEVNVEQSPADGNITVSLSNPSYPIPENGRFILRYNDEDIDSGIELDLSTDSLSSVNIEEELGWRGGEFIGVIWMHNEYEITVEVGETSLGSRE